MIDVLSIIDQFYVPDSHLRHLLVTHSTSVADLAVKIAQAHPELEADQTFVYEAAMLHDIGIFRCHAPSIHCMGDEPYICHGRIGAELMRAEGYPRHARVCERHTGAGLTKHDIISQKLPLPEEDFLPETIEEKVICYADKFYSKTRLNHEKSFEEALRSLQKFGEEGVLRFREWKNLFE